MEWFVNILSKACVSVWGLVVFNFFVLTINLKFLWWIGFVPYDITRLDMSEFYDIASPLAVRLITVGVIALERHDVLEFAGIIPKGSDHDEISERSHPFGMFYLCFGLIMECFLEELNMPDKIANVYITDDIIVWAAYIISVISVLSCLNLFYVLLFSKGHNSSSAHATD